MAISYVPSGEEHYPYRGQRVEGVEVIVNNRAIMDAPELGVEVVSALWKLYPKNFEIDRVDRLLLNKPVLDQVKNGDDPRNIAASWQSELTAYKAKRAKYLLY
jgi:uncharacterized protein YbbC (DUF1343 family)